MIWTLFSVSIISIILCFIPWILNRQLSENVLHSDDIFIAFNSVSLKVVLGSCISVSIPLLLEIALDCALARSRRIMKNILTNILLVWSLIIPDAILLSYVLPNLDFTLFACMGQARDIAAVSSVYAYFIIVGGEYFQRKIHMCWYLLVNVSVLLLLWHSFEPVDPFNIMQWASTICMFIAMISYLALAREWFRKQAQELSSDRRSLSTDEYCCNIYIIAFIACYCGIMLTRLAFGRPTYGHMNTNYLITVNIIYAFFYVVISVFQGGAVRRHEIIENSMKVKKKFVRYISHEMRTPLNAVSLGLKYLGDKLPKYVQDSDILDSVATSQSACSVTVNILTDLLTFDKIEDGELKLDRQDVSVKDLIVSSTAIFQAQAREKGVTLTTEISLDPRLLIRQGHLVVPENTAGQDEGQVDPAYSTPGDDVIVYVDRNKMSQVIHNLVSNGLKFTPSGGRVTVTVTLENGQRSPRGDATSNAEGSSSPVDPLLIKIQVTDTGVGLSQENIRKLFGQVIQFNPEILQAGGGSGLGLFSKCFLPSKSEHTNRLRTASVSKSILDLHGGTITVTSAGESQGCTFTVLLPVRSCDRSTSMQPRAVAPRVAPGTTLLSAVHPYLPPLSAGSHCPPHTVGVAESLTGNADSDMTGERKVEGEVPSESSVTKSKFASPSSSLWARSQRADNSLQRISKQSAVGDSNGSNPSGRPPPNTISTEMEKKKNELVSDKEPLPRVLVVDDAVSNRKMLCRVLRSRCAAIVEADDGQKALEIVRETMRGSDQLPRNNSPPFDLILMDFVMPVMDGPTAIKEIRDLGYKGLIFGLTGNVLDGDKDLMIANGADFVLTKPFNIDVFDRAFLAHKARALTVPTAEHPSGRDRQRSDLIAPLSTSALSLSSPILLMERPTLDTDGLDILDVVPL